MIKRVNVVSGNKGQEKKEHDERRRDDGAKPEPVVWSKHCSDGGGGWIRLEMYGLDEFLGFFSAILILLSNVSFYL